MKWSWRLATVAGIGIYIHWTFLILLVWVIFVHWQAGSDLSVLMNGILFVLAIFGCIVLHELGHALAARHYGIQTRDITLLPIGGLARLERMPEDPWQEFWVALAGPAVNVVIAAVLFGVLVLFYTFQQLFPQDESFVVRGSFLIRLMWVNVILVVFNLIPAFPMDGGRVLRALLAMRMPYVHATQVAASVGQALAILFGMAGILVGHWGLLFIAIFVYLGAQQEAHMAAVRSAFQGVPVSAVMATNFRTLEPDDTLTTALDALIAGTQQDFPVVHEGKLQGMLSRQDIFKAVAEGGLNQRVEEVMHHHCLTVDEAEMLADILPRMQENSCPSLPVMRNGQLVGLLTQDNIGEWAMIQSAIRAYRTRRPA